MFQTRLILSLLLGFVLILLGLFTRAMVSHKVIARTKHLPPQCTLTISPVSLPDISGGIVYTQTFTATGGVAPYSFIQSGILPYGLTLTNDGKLSGTPNVAGTFNFSVTATDANGCTGIRNYRVSVTVTLGPQTGALYFLVDSRALGNQIIGLAVNENTGSLTLLPGFPFETGYPGTPGTFEASRLTIDRKNLRLYSINKGIRNVTAYAINPTTGALTPLPFSPIDLRGLEGFPNWNNIAVHPSGSPLLLTNDNYLFSYKITDLTASLASRVDSNDSNIVFSQDGDYVYVGGSSLSNLAIKGFHVSATTGTLTPLSGSPFNTGSGGPVARATDSTGRLFISNSRGEVTRIFTTSNGIPSPVAGNPFFSNKTDAFGGLLHPSGYYLATNGYSLKVYRINGNGTATTLVPVDGSPFVMANNPNFPSDVALSLNQAGTFLFTTQVWSSLKVSRYRFDNVTGTTTLIETQNIDAFGTITDSRYTTGMAYLPPPCQTLSLLPNALAGGLVGQAYNQTITALPLGSYNFSITAGALPAGLSLNATTGAITGTPTMANTANFTIMATSSMGCSGSQSYSINIQPGCPSVSGINPASGITGATLTITGTNFTGVNAVKFANNISAAFTIVSDAQITATVPAGAVTGAIAISKPLCTDVTTAAYTVLPKPTITLSPSAQLIGTGQSATLTATISPALPTAITLALTSSNSTVAAVPMPPSIPAGQTSVQFTVTGASAGTAIITATVPALYGSTSATSNLTVVAGFEADVSPRPGGNGNGQVTTADWVQMGRFVAGLDSITEGSEFQRADCAPRATFGNGLLTASDWVQAGRYAAGLDPLVAAGGPSAPVNQLSLFNYAPMHMNVGDQLARKDRSAKIRLIQDTSSLAGSLMIELESDGAANALAFSLSFNPTEWQFVSATVGQEFAAAQLLVNASQPGSVGCLLTLPSGEAFAPGVRNVLRIRFQPLIAEQSDPGGFSFANHPIQSTVVDYYAEEIEAEFFVTDRTHIEPDQSNPPIPIRPLSYDENQGPPARDINVQTITVTYDGVSRNVSFYVPSTYQPGKAVPLVFAFHDTTGNAAMMYAPAKGIPQKAEAEGFIAVFPNGLPLANGGNGFQWMDAVNVPYVGFLIDQLQARFTIDAKRIYLIGFSGGSQLCQRIASDPTQSKRIAAIGTVADSADFQPGPGQPFIITDPNASGLAQPLSAFIVQGALDPVNPINGGPNMDGFVQLSFADKINFWTKFINSNLTEPTTIAQAPVNATTTKYSNLQTGLTLIGLVDPLLAHAWPQWDVTTAIWNFFKSVPTR